MIEDRQCTMVSFKSIEIIELPYTLGDNPCVSSGCPIMPSWEAQKRTTFRLDFFERYRPKRRSKFELHIPKEARKQLMLQAGFTPSEISVAAKEAATIRKGRYQTLNQLRARLRELIAKSEADPEKFGLPPHQESSPHYSSFPSSHKHNLLAVTTKLTAKPSPISPKRKRSDRISDGGDYHFHMINEDETTRAAMDCYNHSTTKRLRSPIKTRTTRHVGRRHHHHHQQQQQHYYYHPCSQPPPLVLDASSHKQCRIDDRCQPLIPPKRMLSPQRIMCSPHRREESNYPNVGAMFLPIRF